jgi:HK97 family phage major capsid protein
MTPAGSTTEPQALPERGGQFIGRPKVEWTSHTASGVTTGTKVGIYADWNSMYKIVDRIGSSIELVPHVVGATNRYPKGSRGLYFYWRVGAGVVNANAGRYLEVL